MKLKITGHTFKGGMHMVSLEDEMGRSMGYASAEEKTKEHIEEHLSKIHGEKVKLTGKIPEAK